MELNLEKRHRNNLEKMALGMLALSPQYNRDHFLMSIFLAHNGNEIRLNELQNELTTHICGTAACAVGHAPIIFKRQYKTWLAKQDSYLFKYRASGAIWSAFSHYLFGLKDSMDDTWSFLFGAMWEHASDNYARTSWAVADRIALVLNGDFDENTSYSQQMNDNKYLSASVGWTTHEQLAKNEAAFDELIAERGRPIYMNF